MSRRFLSLCAAVLLVSLCLVSTAVAAASPSDALVWVESYNTPAHCSSARSPSDALRSMGGLRNGTGCYFDGSANVAFSAHCSDDGKEVTVALYMATQPEPNDCDGTPWDTVTGPAETCLTLQHGASIRASCRGPLPLQQKAIATQVFTEPSCDPSSAWGGRVEGLQIYTTTSDECQYVNYYPTRQYVALRADGQADVVQYQWTVLNGEGCAAAEAYNIQLVAQAGPASCSAKDVIGDGEIRFVRTLLPENVSFPAPPLAYPPPAALVVHTCAKEDCSAGCDVLSYVRQHICHDAQSEGGLSNARTLSADGLHAAVSFFHAANCTGDAFLTNVEPLGVERCFGNFYRSASSPPPSSEAMRTPLGEVVQMQFSQSCDMKAPSLSYSFYRAGGVCAAGATYSANDTAVTQQPQRDMQCSAPVGEPVGYPYEQCFPARGEVPASLWSAKQQPKQQGSDLAKLAGWVYEEEEEQSSGVDAMRALRRRHRSHRHGQPHHGHAQTRAQPELTHA